MREEGRAGVGSTRASGADLRVSGHAKTGRLDQRVLPSTDTVGDVLVADAVHHYGHACTVVPVVFRYMSREVLSMFFMNAACVPLELTLSDS